MTLKQSALETGRGDGIRPPRLRYGRRLLFPALALGFFLALSGCSQFNSTIHLTRGKKLYEAGKYNEAEKEFRFAIRMNPDNIEAVFQHGRTLLHRQEYLEAEKEFRQVLQVKPKDYDAHFNLGNALNGQGKYPEAEKEYLESKRNDWQADREVVESLTGVLKKQGKYKVLEIRAR